ncbi:hypothetical protein [Candidatus Nitrosocosmicus hydrocola]|jgi:hypothetical protein|uniref:hypothetical protein n=1 Tax=Candidatus Nitrosocosmicus hydrocola TaxID=1826872 RepID=UPI0011E5F838|nr:hypothetical protein [Candidatus Nitrosocosmicus hydrocola]
MNKNQTSLAVLSIFIAAALIGSIVTIGDNMAFAKKKSNEAAQGIEQSSATGQDAGCFSENGTTLASCNNVALSFNLNDGKNALGQQ